jgi:hypothetical protein
MLFPMIKIYHEFKNDLRHMQKSHGNITLQINEENSRDMALICLC